MLEIAIMLIFKSLLGPYGSSPVPLTSRTLYGKSSTPWSGGNKQNSLEQEQNLLQWVQQGKEYT